jgi:hypothetical protein
MLFGIVWMSSQAVMPAVIGRRSTAASPPGLRALLKSALMLLRSGSSRRPAGSCGTGSRSPTG